MYTVQCHIKEVAAAALPAVFGAHILWHIKTLYLLRAAVIVKSSRNVTVEINTVVVVF